MALVVLYYLYPLKNELLLLIMIDEWQRIAVDTTDW